jgi:tRNA-splicing ligase RtcB
MTRYHWTKLGTDKIDAVFYINPGDLEKTCLDQIRLLMKLPFAKQHLTVFPDAHTGYGMPIGTVLATDDVVIPYAVGSDIGCGMLAVRLTGIPECNVHAARADLNTEIRRFVPVGTAKHDKMALTQYMPDMGLLGIIGRQEFANARRQLGTLGGGNHFIELQIDTFGRIWVMIHSGSRNLGYKVCQHYSGWAAQENARNFSMVPAGSKLGFFHRSHDGYAEYVEEMRYCIDFAARNRKAIFLAVLKAFRNIWPTVDIEPDTLTDICHNHMSIEHHFGKNVHVHRKGAAGPYRGEGWGIIPGSKGSMSYIVRHTGEPLSYASTSHGAGRAMSRKAAKERLDLATEQAKLKEMDVFHGLQGVSGLDEAPGAYKDISKVMEAQEQVCEVMYKLKPILSIKG